MRIKHKALIQRVRYWRDVMGLQAWDIIVSRESAADVEADCEPKWQYRYAKLRFNLGQIDDQEELDELIVHELTHLLTDQVSDIAVLLAGGNVALLKLIHDAEDLLVTDVMRIVVRLNAERDTL